MNWIELKLTTALSSCDSAGAKGRLLACSGRDMSHVSGPRLAAGSAQSHNTDDANSAHKEEIYAKRFIALGSAINLRPQSVGRGRILSGARCEVGRSPCTSSLRTPCQGGPGGAWRSRLWLRTVGKLCNPYAQCIWIEGGWGVYDHLTWSLHVFTTKLLLSLPSHVIKVRISCCKNDFESPSVSLNIYESCCM